jgi:hypothetical protein
LSIPDGLRWDEKGSFDLRCCRFLQVDYATPEVETLREGKTDEKMLALAFANGCQLHENENESENENEMWQAFMTSRGWRDASTQRLNERLAEIAESRALATKQSVALALEEP